MSSSQANAKMKKFTLRGVLDGLRSSVSAPTKSDTEIEETLRSEHFHTCKTVRHGFPFQPTAVAFDPVQHILAVGNKTGSLRIIGRPGVDIHSTHDGEVAILQILFLINEGALVTVCSDDTLHLWNYRQKKPEIVHSLKFQRERITYCHLPFQSKWLYIGTERGNVHIVNIESFILSGYVINWNKAIELCRKTHPGPVVHLSDNPVDTNKLLIGFESGAIVMWDLRNKFAEYRYNSPEALRAVAWHQEGKQFMCCHSDGSLTTWNIKMPHKAASVLMPHAKLGAEGKPDPCKPITKVAWKTVRNGEDMVIFSGGMSYERAGRTPSITVMTGKSTTVLEMEHNVIDFVVLCETPWSHDLQDPYAIVVLLQNDLVVVDLTSHGYPCFENPYPMDLHESPVTACQYYANCPTDLIPAFYSVGSRQKKTGFSEKVWPVKGGQWGTTTVSYPEIMITGHADGSLKFWDASSVSLQILYKLKTAKIFDKPKRPTDVQDDDPFAIQIIFLCPESRMLCVAGASHVMLFRFCKQELTLEVSSLEFSIVYEIYDELESPEFEYPTIPKPSLAVTNEYNSSMGSCSSSTSDNAKTEQMTAVKVRPGARKWAAGYQADLVCILCYVEGEPPGNITVMSLNSSYGLLAFGNESGLAIVDFVQKTCLLNLGTPDLYGSMDPYQRAPRSPRNKKSQSESLNPASEEGKSPTTDLLPCVQSAITKTPSPNPPPRSKPKHIGQLTSIEETNVANRNEDLDSHTTASCQTSALDHSKEPLAEETVEAPVSLSSINEDGDQSSFKTVSSAAVQDGKDSSSVLLDNMDERSDSKSSLCKALSDQGPVTSTEQDGEDLALRRSMSDSSKKPKDSEHPVKFTSVMSRLRKMSWKRIRQQNQERVDNQDKFQTVETSDQNVEEADDASAFSDNSPQAQAPPQQGAEDAVAAEGRSPDSSDSQPHSKSFLRKVSVKLKSPFSLKNKSESEEETVERRFSRDRTKSVKEKRVEVVDLTEDSDKKPSIRKVCVVDMCNNTYRMVPSRVFCPSPTSLRAKKLELKRTKSQGITRIAHKLASVTSMDDWNCGGAGYDGIGTTVHHFPRSRSSSISSLDNVTKEAIQCLVFADSYTRKTDNFTCPCLWVGTSLGSVIVINLNLPGLNGDQRALQPVIVSPSGTIFRLKGAIVGMSFLDCNGILIQSVFDQWKDSSGGGVSGSGGSSTSLVSYGREKDNRDIREEKSQKASRQMSVSTKPKISPTSSQELATDRQFVIICSEKQARVMSLPSQTCAYKVKITETSFVVRAEIVSLRDSVCLMCYVANGHIMAFSLPSLKPLFDDDFLPLTDYRLARTFCFSNNGHALYLCSPTEVQKITYSAEIAENLSEMLGDLFLPCDTPEAPKQGFFKNLFGGGTSNLDREELFGEASGKASKGLAKHIPGAGGIQHLQQQTGAIGGEFARTRLLVAERGERLGELDDSSARMMSQAENFAQAAHQIMLKYKDKKWYQF